MPPHRRVARQPRHPSGRFALMAAGVLVFVALMAACVFWFPGAIVDRDRDRRAPSPLTQAEELEAKNDVRVILLQGVGGLAVLVAAGGGVWATLREVRVSRDGQLTERFTHAVEQLGSQQVDVRIGGLFALERIAEDSPADRGPIQEILVAFVRNHAPWPKGSPSAPGAGAADVAHLRVRSADVAAATTVIGRSLPWRDPDVGLELGSVDLRNAYLVGADLSHAYLNETNFNGAWLHGACLAGAELGQSGLRDLHARQVDLRGANLYLADLTGADLRRARLEGARLRGAELRGVRLEGARLDGTDLRGARLDGAALDGAIADELTGWPDGLDPAAAGVVVEAALPAR